MKKALSIILAVVCFITCNGCTSINNSKNKKKISEKIVMEYAEKIEYESYAARDANDFEAFAKLCDGVDKRNIKELNNAKQLYSSLGETPNYEKLNSSSAEIIASNDESYLISITHYVVTGSHPNTQMESISDCIAIKRVDDDFKLITSQSELNILADQVKDKLRGYDSFIDNLEAGRNAVMFDDTNYMFTKMYEVYKGHSQVEIKFASQNEDGSVDIVLWIANGTGEPIHYQTGVLQLVDNNLGTIIDVQINLDQTIAGIISNIFYYHIPAENVLTGTSTWTQVSSQANITFE